MKLTDYIEELLEKKNKENNGPGSKKIIFMEGDSKRMTSAAISLTTMGLLTPIMVFETKEQMAKVNSLHLETILIGEDQDLFNELVDAYVIKRKGKETKEQAIENMKKTEYFSSMMVQTGKADGAIGGIYHPTSDILRGAFKSIGPVPGVKTISSIMLMHRNDNWYIFTDISVNVKPTKEQLVDIAKNAYDFGDVIDFKKKIAFLSFSTGGSAENEHSLMIREATEIFNNTFKPEYTSIGEVQFDAAFDLKIREQKYKHDDGFKKMPTIFVFPDLNSGNIGYKIAQRMGAWGAVGPIITGMAKPVNDLSRGSTAEDIKYTAIVTALQAFKK